MRARMLDRLEDIALRKVLCDTLDALKEHSGKVPNLIYLDALICRGINFNKLINSTLRMISRLYDELLLLKVCNKLSDDDFKTSGHMLIHKINFNKLTPYTSYELTPYTLGLMSECCSDNIKPVIKEMLRRRVKALPLVWDVGLHIHNADDFCKH